VLSLGLVIVLFPSLWTISIGLAVICLGFFVTHSIAATTVTKTATHHKGSASSLYLVAYYIGVSAGTTLLSPVWDTYAWTGVITVAAILPILYYGLVSLFQKRKALIK